MIHLFLHKDCAIFYITNTGTFKLKDTTIIERTRVTTGTSYVYMLSTPGIRMNTVTENLSYYKSYTAIGFNDRLKMWNSHH